MPDKCTLCHRCGSERDGCNCILGQRHGIPFKHWDDGCTCARHIYPTLIPYWKHHKSCQVTPIYASVVADVGLPRFPLFEAIDILTLNGDHA